MDFTCTNFEIIVRVEFLINKIMLVEFILCTTQLVRISQSTIFPGSKNYIKRGPFITDFFQVFFLVNPCLTQSVLITRKENSLVLLTSEEKECSVENTHSNETTTKTIKKKIQFPITETTIPNSDSVIGKHIYYAHIVGNFSYTLFNNFI